jgi:WD40 repeat protein/class 3 adenylate cyclase
MNDGLEAGDLEVGAPVTVRTFLIADIRGYSRFSRERGDAAAAALAKRFADHARDAVEARGGEVVELRGDEAFAAFPTEAQAVRAAVELQLTCAEETERDPSLPLLVGIGIDAGPAVPVEDGYRGIAINLAARLCSAAGAGQVLVTAAAAASAGDLPELVLSGQGPSTFKGFEDPIEVVDVKARHEPAQLDTEAVGAEPLPPALVDRIPIVGRAHELRWLRGTWRQVRRGNGRVLCLSGPEGIGKSRVAAGVAEHVQATGGAVRYSGSGGSAVATALALVHELEQTTAPTLAVIDDLDVVGADVVDAVTAAVPTLRYRPVLLLLVARDTAAVPALAGLVDEPGRPDQHRVLAPLDPAEVADVVRLYAGDSITDAPVETIVRASRGVPALIHEAASEWARTEASRRLEAAAEFMAAVRDRRSADLGFANNVIGLKLGQLYADDAATADDRTVDVGPYKGLAAFDADDATWFFGREQLVGELAARTVGAGLLAVVGSSGSGKSSVVAAGLLPSLRAGLLPGSQRWKHVWLRPGAHPGNALREALGSTATEPLPAAVTDLSAESRLIVVIDQFEETFTLCGDDAERTAFLSQLADAAEQLSDRLAIVLTLRSDFYGQLAPYPRLAALVSANHVLVGPLSRPELQRVIQLPAQRAGVRIETRLVETLVDEAANEPGVLPLLSTALVELWQTRTGGWIRMSSYEETGGIHGAVARLAEASYAELDEAEQAAARRVLLRLVAGGEGEAATRRRVELSEFDLGRDASATRVIQRFTDDRLLTAAGTTVEVAHEALLREWPRLRQWLEEDVQGRVLRLHLTEAAKTWDAQGRERSDVYRGARLSTALDWSSQHDADLNDLERSFLAASRALSVEEAESVRRTNRRLRTLLVGAVVLLVAASGAGLVALAQRSSAKRESTVAVADALGAQAVSQPRLDRAMLLANQAVVLNSNAETRSDLLSTLMRAPTLIRTYHQNRNRLNGIGLSPDGKLLALADNNANVSIEDVATGRVLSTMSDIVGNAAVFTRDGRMLKYRPDSNGLAQVPFWLMNPRTGKADGTWGFAAAVGQVATPNTAAPASAINPPAPGEPTIAFSPSGRTAAVGLFPKDPSKRDYIFQLAYPSGRIVGPTLRVGSPPASVVAQGGSPNKPLATYIDSGRTLAVDTGEGTSFYDAKSGRLRWHIDVGQLGAISPDGKVAATGTPSGELDFVDLRTGKTMPAVGLAPGGVRTMAFTPDGTQLVTGSQRGAVQVWDVASRNVLETLDASSEPIVGLALSKTGEVLYTGSFDAIAAAWSLTGRAGSVPAFQAVHTDLNQDAFSLAMSPAGDLLAVGSSSGQVTILDASTLQPVRTFNAITGVVAAVSWSSDGRSLLVAGDFCDPAGPPVSCLRIWHLHGTARPTPGATAKSPFEFTTYAAFTHDGRYAVASGLKSGDINIFATHGDIGIWRTSDGSLAAPTTGVRHGVPTFIAASPVSDEVAASGGGGSIEVVDPLHSKVVLQRHGHGEFVNAVAYSPNGATVAGADFDGRVDLIDVATGTQRRVVLGTSGFASVAFSPDGTMLNTVDWSDNDRLYAVDTFRQIGSTYTPPWADLELPPIGLHGSVTVFAPDGSRVYTSDETGHLWVLPTSVRLQQLDACTIANRSFTQPEWSLYVPGRGYQPGCHP